MFKSSAFVISNLQLLAFIGCLLTIPLIGFSSKDLVYILLGYFLYAGVGVSMTLHRYWSHKSFEFKYPIIRDLFTFIALIAGRGGVLSWAHVHREHHKYSDSTNDPHDPTIKQWRVFFPHLLGYGGKVDKFLVRDLLTERNLFIEQYYVLILLAWGVTLYFYDIHFLVYGWFVPIIILHLMISSFIYWGHDLGYSTHTTKDKSKNFWFFGLFFFGEGWHNNHHKNPKDYSLGEKWWELDPVAWIIRLVKQ